jgi:hypothetical protein
VLLKTGVGPSIPDDFRGLGNYIIPERLPLIFLGPNVSALEKGHNIAAMSLEQIEDRRFVGSQFGFVGLLVRERSSQYYSNSEWYA